MGFEIRSQLWFLLKPEGKISKLTHIAILKKRCLTTGLLLLIIAAVSKLVSSVDSKGKQRIFHDTKCRFLLKNKSHTSTALFTGADVPFTISLAVF